MLKPEPNNENMGRNVPVAAKGSIQRLAKVTREFQESRGGVMEIVAEDVFEVRPSEVSFPDVTPGTQHSTTLLVTNKTLRKRKIKILPPKSEYFTLETKEVESVAPGLALEAKVIFRAPSHATPGSEDFADSLTVVSEGVVRTVALRAFAPGGLLLFDPAVDFGFASAEESAWRTVEFENRGHLDARVEVASQDLCLRADPQVLTVPSGSRASLKLELSGAPPGPFARRLALDTAAQTAARFLDIRAQVVPFAQFLVDESGAEAAALDFGPTLVGQKARKGLTLVNNAPAPVGFTVTVIKGAVAGAAEAGQLQTPAEKGREQAERTLFIEPAQGELAAYSLAPLRFLFHAAPLKDEQIWANKFAVADGALTGPPPSRVFEYTVLLTFSKGATRSLRVSALGLVPKLAVSSTRIDFGDTLVGAEETRGLRLLNHSPLPLQVDGPSAPFLRCRPSAVALPPGGSAEVSFAFRPRNAGPLAARGILAVSGGFRIELSFLGSSSFRGRGEANRAGAEAKPPEPEPPTRPAPLFVIKPIKHHEPASAIRSEAKFVPDPRAVFKELRATPKDNEETGQVRERLSGEKLMKVQVGPTTLNFGRVFVRSTNSLYFQVKNELRSSIKARILTDCSELAGSATGEQIIPSNRVAGFRVELCCPVVRFFRETIRYVINECHVFQALVVAEVIPAELEVSRSTLHFRFKEDSLDRVAVERLGLFNRGSIAVRYRLSLESGVAFKLSEVEGSIAPGESGEVAVSYAPISTRDEDTLTVEVLDGGARTVRLSGVVNESRCELVGGALSLNMLAVGQRRTASLSIRNHHPKFPAIFAVEESTRPDCVEIFPRAGRVLPDSETKLDIEIFASRRLEFKNHEILISVRGSAPLKAILNLSTIVPQIEIDEAEFDFGEVTFGSKAFLPLTLRNRSAIPAELSLSLASRDPAMQENLECLSIEYKASEPNDAFGIEQAEAADDPPPAERGRRLLFPLQPEGVYSFSLGFSPLKPADYAFELAFRFPGSDAEGARALVRRVRCRGTRPRFLMRPFNGVLDFPKKIISAADAALPDFEQLTLSNPDAEQGVEWRLDVAALEAAGVFTVSPASGVIDPQKTVTLRVCFRPSKPQKYSYALPLFLGSDLTASAEVVLNGEGAYPKVVLDAEELVLPPVPLGVNATGWFTLTNDGYQSSAITATLLTEDLAVPLTVEFIGGNLIGINCPKLRVSVSFVSHVPLSFTARILFEDEHKRSFAALVSGAADNSIFTTFLSPHPSTPLPLNPSTPAPIGRIPVEVTEAESTRTAELLQRVGNSVKGWLTEYGVCSLSSFPDDFVRAEGQPLYELLAFLLKSAPARPTIDPSLKRTDYVIALVEGYSTLLSFLKAHGAAVSTVRPQNLLGYKDLLLYYKQRQVAHVNAGYYRPTENAFKITSASAWASAVLQALKLFFVGRISSRQLKSSLAAFPEAKGFALDPMSERHPVFSPAELCLLRWVEFFARRDGFDPPPQNFDKDFSHCGPVAAVVDSYLQPRADANARGRPGEDFLQCFERLHRKLLDYGVKEDLTEDDFLVANPVNMVLLLAHLFKTLPFYVPRGTIEFKCSLQEKLTKEISFSSPGSKSINYAVNLFGHKDFSISSDTLKIDGKSPDVFTVSYFAHTSLPATGRVIFQNRKNGKSIAGAVVFDLKAEVVARSSRQVLALPSVNLYELGSFEIFVENPFEKDVEFKITVEHSRVESSKPDKQARKAMAKKDAAELEAARRAAQLSPPSFFVKTDRLSVKKGGSAKLILHYLPLTFETHRAFLIFLDPKVGELQYEVCTKPSQPNSLDSFKFIQHVESFSALELAIPAKNNFFAQAAAKLNEKFKDLVPSEMAQQVERLAAAPPPLFEVEVSPPGFLGCPALFSPKPRGPGEPPQKLGLTPISKVPFKDLFLQVKMRGANRLDFRIYDVFLTVLPRPVKATLEIKTTARMPVSQDIPVTNPYDVDCVIKPTLIPMLNSDLFIVGKEPFVAKKNSVTQFNVKFLPVWIERAEARIELFNSHTNDKFEYLVTASAEEPLSEKNIPITTKAKKPTEIKIDIKNPIPESRNFKVTCDIPGAEFPSSVYINNNSSFIFSVNFVAKLGGQFLNALTFTDERGRYFWYLITTKVEPPESFKELTFTTEIRKPIACKMEIDNPSDKEITYNVLFQGEQISGNSSLIVPPNSTESYNLIYYPSRVEEVRKKVGFLNSEEGEIWFDLSLIATEAKPVKLPTFRTELGKSTTQKVSLKNFLKKKAVRVDASIAENSNFSLGARSFEIAPNSTYELEITYTPRELNQNESETVVLSSASLGDWKYLLFGVGVQPTDFEATNIISYLGKNATKTLSFRNPFAYDISVQVYFEQPQPPVFDLLIPKTRSLVIPGLTTTQLIFRFVPTEINTIKASLVVRLNESIFWRFPVIGVTESFNTKTEFTILTQCGKEVECTREFLIDGIKNVDPQEAFDFSVKIPGKEAEIYEKWLTIKPIKVRLANDEDEKLAFLFTFLPNKPFKTVMDFFVIRESGGRWRFKIGLEATNPDYFDTINIISQLNVRKSVHFRLFNNDKKAPSPFTARFTQESDSEFRVEPASGILEPVINDGTLIQIDYLPVEYGKPKIGTLIVETETFMWRFLVKGSFGKYVPPAKMTK